MKLDIVLIIILFAWISVLTGAVISMFKNMYTRLYDLQGKQHVENTKKKTYFVPSKGIFTTRKKRSPIVNTDKKMYLQEQEKIRQDSV